MELNEDAGEFWVPNPFDFSKTGHNLSAYERNGIHLNLGGLRFADISYLTGADSPGDGRSVVGADLNGDGMPELLIRQAGGGPLLVRENHFPQQSWTKLILRGETCNRLGIGAKVSIETDTGWLYRENYPVINFLSQSPAWLEVGLGQATEIKQIVVSWPGGKHQVFETPPMNQTLILRQGTQQPELPPKN